MGYFLCRVPGTAPLIRVGKVFYESYKILLVIFILNQMNKAT